ncbi:TonB-dependent receptor plug domain-containing protein [bacterium]|nr:TonB-dependent receptor plug domain-containing protein [bacterium]
MSLGRTPVFVSIFSPSLTFGTPKIVSMLKRLLLVTFVATALSAFGQTQPGSLRGKVTSAKSKEELFGVQIQIKQGTTLIAGGVTDFEGNYNINPVPPGKYTVTYSGLGYQTQVFQGIEVPPGRPRVQNVSLKDEQTGLNEVVVTAEAPLIDGTKTSKEIGGEAFANIGIRDLNAGAALTPGVFQTDAGQGINIRGARDNTNVYFIDGVKVRGSISLPQSAIGSVEVITGGLPAQYGDATGGVISTTTRGPSPEYFGSLEYVTSSLFDDYNYNLINATVGGPIIKKDGQAKMGFLFAGEFQFQDDGFPSAVPVYKLKDDVLADLEQTPVRPAVSGVGVLNRSEFVTLDDFETQQARLNAANYELRLNGSVNFRLNSKSVLTAGGRYILGEGTNYNRASSLFNYNNFGEFRDSDWSTFVRFQQSFARTPVPGEEPQDEKEKSLISNAFYTIQLDYTRNNRRDQDSRFEDNFFQYGHVGTFQTSQARLYGFGEDTATGLVGWRHVVWQDTATTFTPSPYNTVLGNYTQTYYDLVESGQIFGSTASRDFIRLGNALVNGDNPASVYNDLWTNIGAQISNYNLTQNSQFRVTASSTFDIKNHSLIVGFEYEQRTDRSYALAARGLWNQMFLLQNDHIRELDFSQPQAVYDEFGVFQDTINYPRLFDAEKPRTFDRNVRTKLGLDPNGLDWLDINSYDPNFFSLDMFSADELINLGGTQYVSYYGYDYTGKLLTNKPSLNDFFTKRDENGNLTREIGAFEPIYISGYIQDQFTFEDLFFRVGLRVDRYDANQSVLKDPYVLFPRRTVGDLGGTPLQDASIPTNIGSDYVVYVDDIANPTSIVGYRDGSNWYDADGNPEANPKRIADASGGIKPYLYQADPEQQVLTAESFVDYTPQINVMPRVSFNFPISDEALFLAHYDVLVQRPDGPLSRLDLLELLQLQVQNNAGTLNNPNLLPQRTTEYELGFQQKLNERSSLTISAFYRELRDMLQTISLNEAYPITYVTYGNQDFGTVKGLTLSYDLRRTNNVAITANYTLQFAAGSGSGPNSGANIARSGQPNLRYILPFDYDSRHQIVVNLDYRYGRGPNYKGPVWWDTKVFENAGINFSVFSFSGTPYSRRVQAYPITSNANSVQLDGQINGSRLPWQFRMDMRINKVWDIAYGKDKAKSFSLEGYLFVQNLFDTRNVLNVYPFTGSAEDDGYLTSAQAQNVIASQVDAQSYTDLYNIRMANPGNYTLPRRLRLGVVFSF